jgi:hypothetical protein
MSLCEFESQRETGAGKDHVALRTKRTRSGAEIKIKRTGRHREPHQLLPDIRHLIPNTSKRALASAMALAALLRGGFKGVEIDINDIIGLLHRRGPVRTHKPKFFQPRAALQS